MSFSSSGERLYRRARTGVILGLLALLTSSVAAQYSQRPTAAPKQSKGPRAIGLVQLSPDGKAKLIPVAILYNGEFFDASAYKASPVPMALESGTVYEAERTGASLGLFTITGALQTKDSWLGVGTWEAASAAKAKKKVAAASKPPDEDTDAPPVLRRSGSAPPKPPEAAPQPKGDTPPPAPTPAAPAPAAPTQPPATADNDHPVLKRGVQPQFEPKEEKTPSPATVATNKTAPLPAKGTTVQVIPAISDAHGPEPLPFKYELKPDEEQVFRKKILAMASGLVLERDKTLSAEANPPARTAPTPRRQKTQVKPAQPVFEDVDLRIFDLNNANEPVLVLTATAHMPLTATTSGRSGLQYYVTLVARNDIYGDLHKAFVNISDTQHLDILPRMELIDAVDADGDGRGELLFRQSSDAGQAFVIYRVIGDQLYALYQGTPSGS